MLVVDKVMPLLDCALAMGAQMIERIRPRIAARYRGGAGINEASGRWCAGQEFRGGGGGEGGG